MKTRSKSGIVAVKKISTKELEDLLYNYHLLSSLEQKVIYQRLDATFHTQVGVMAASSSATCDDKTKILWRALMEYHTLPVYKSLACYTMRHDVDVALGTTTLHVPHKDRCSCPAS